MDADLFECAYENDVDGLHRALAAGAVANDAPPRAGTLPLQLACQGNAIAAVKALLDSGATAAAVLTRAPRVDGRIFANHSPLMYAESVEAAKLLLDAGADLEVADERGWTALVCAAHAGNLALVRYLLERGASASVQPAYLRERKDLCG